MQPCTDIVASILVHAGYLSKLQVSYHIFRLPDPFAFITVDLEQIYVTSMMEKVLNRHWNEDLDVPVIFFLDACLVLNFYQHSVLYGLEATVLSFVTPNWAELLRL
jgi:hypothetical protein